VSGSDFTIPTRFLALSYTSAPPPPKGVVVSHATILAISNHINSWLPPARSRRAPARAPDFSHPGFSFIFAAPAFGTCADHDPEIQPATSARLANEEPQSARAGADEDKSAYPIAELKQFT